jgi:hypothetical protein
MDVLHWIWTVSDDDDSGGIDCEEYITMHSHHIIVVRGMAMRKQNAE